MIPDADHLAPNKMQSMRSKADGSLNDSQSVMPENSMDGGSIFDKSAMNVNRINEHKEKNLAVQNLNKFRRKLKATKSKTMDDSAYAETIINMLPPGLDMDVNEAFLYAYFTVRYFTPHVFRVIVSRANFESAVNANVARLMTRDRAYDLLVAKGRS